MSRRGCNLATGEVGIQTEPDGGRGDDLDVEIGQRNTGSCRDAFEASAPMCSASSAANSRTRPARGTAKRRRQAGAAQGRRREADDPGTDCARRPHSKAEYMTAPERFADSQIPLVPRASSIHDSLDDFRQLVFTLQSPPLRTLPHPGLETDEFLLALGCGAN